MLEVIAFVYALGVTARLIGGLWQNPQNKVEWHIPEGFRGVLIKTLIAGLFVIVLSISFIVRFQRLWEPEYGRVMMAILFIFFGSPICWLLVPTWQRYCERNQPDAASGRLRLPAYVGFSSVQQEASALTCSCRELWGR